MLYTTDSHDPSGIPTQADAITWVVHTNRRGSLARDGHIEDVARRSARQRVGRGGEGKCRHWTRETERIGVVSYWVILAIGVTVGLFARFVPRRKRPPGGWLTSAYGVVGALLGGWLGEAFQMYEGESAGGYVLSAAVAAFFVAVHRAIAQRRMSA